MVIEGIFEGVGCFQGDPPSGPPCPPVNFKFEQLALEIFCTAGELQIFLVSSGEFFTEVGRKISAIKARKDVGS